MQADDKADITKIWDGGFRHWDTCSRAPFSHLEGDADTRLLVVSSNNIDLLGFRTLLYRMAGRYAGASYLQAIADDLGGSSGAVEPWNSGG